MGVKIHSKGLETTDVILKGAVAAADVISSTLGRQGKLVTLSGVEGMTSGKIRVTKDGASIAKYIEFRNKVENAGAHLVVSASIRAAELVGDGTTTTATVLGELMKQVANAKRGGYNIVEICAALKEGSAVAKKALDEITTQIKGNKQMLMSVVNISVNGDTEIADLLTKVFFEVGPQAKISIVESGHEVSNMEKKEGYCFDRGYKSAHFLKDSEVAKGKISLDRPYVLLTDQTLTSYEPIAELLQQINKEGRSLVIIADQFDETVLKFFKYYRITGALNVVCVEIPGFSEKKKKYIEDISIFTGARPVLKELGQDLFQVTLADLGTPESVYLEKDSTAIISNKKQKDEILKLIKRVDGEVGLEKNDYEKNWSKERLARLSGGICILDIGGREYTKAGIKERQDRAEDGAMAAACALNYGVTVGGGVELAFAAYKINNAKEISQLTKKMFYAALLAPMKKIVENSNGISPEIVVDRILSEFAKGNYNYGYDVSTGNFVDMKVHGILNPAKVGQVVIDLSTKQAELFCKMSAVVYPDENDEAEKLKNGAYDLKSI